MHRSSNVLPHPGESYVRASNSGVGAACIVHRTSCHIPASHTHGSCPSISSASVRKTAASVLTTLPKPDCSPAVGAGTASLGQTVEHTTGNRHHSHHDRLRGLCKVNTFQKSELTIWKWVGGSSHSGEKMGTSSQNSVILG